MIIRVSWVVSGKVQGVFFRKHTAETATKLGLTGWCRNTPSGREVEGECQGETVGVNQMLEWLRSTGSPKSVIEKFHYDTIPVVDGESSFSIMR